MLRRASRGQPASSNGGFTLVEILVAIAVIATASLMLVATVSSQQKMNSLARERSLATNAVRAYVEMMRQQYPTVSSSQDMSGFIYDPSTPADYLPTSGVEQSAIRDARGLVLKMTDETGFVWGPAAGVGYTGYPGLSAAGTRTLTSTALPWLWTDATMTTQVSNASTSVSPLNTGTYSAHAPPYTWAAASGVATQPSVNDLDAMGFMAIGTTTVAGRDMNGSGSIANNLPASGTAYYVDPTSQLFVPCQITLSWISGSGAVASRQRITIYAAFGPNH